MVCVILVIVPSSGTKKSGVMWSVTLKTPSNCAIMVGLCYAFGKRKLKSTSPTVWQRCSAALTQEEQSLYGEHVTDARRRNGAHGERATDARRRSGAVRRTYKTKGVLPNCGRTPFALMLCVRIRLAQLALPSASLHQREINL